MNGPGSSPVLPAAVSVVVVYHSATGRTRGLAEAVARGASLVPDVAAHVVPVEDAARAQDLLAAADAIVFGCPTYMGSASAGFKAFMDGTSAIWALQGWRDKLAAGFTHSAAPSGDKLGTLSQLAVFAAQHGMVWVGLGLPPTYASATETNDETNRLGSHLGAMAQTRPGQQLHSGDLRTAELLGKRVADAGRRWKAKTAVPLDEIPTSVRAAVRHPTTRDWVFPKRDRKPLPKGLDRVNLREICARPDRFEHHLMVAATIDGVQLEVVTASEPLYFAHINLSDEWALAMPTGDEMVDRFPLRTFVTDPANGTDVGRYNHVNGDMVLHPEGWMHWPGRLRPPYEPFDFPSGMRRTGMSVVVCASRTMATKRAPLRVPADRAGDAKAYVAPGPPMAIVPVLRDVREPGPVARVGRVTVELLAKPEKIAPPKGGWLLVLATSDETLHAAADLVYVPEGSSLDGAGIARAMLLSSTEAAPDPPTPLWDSLPAAPFPPYEDAPPEPLPFVREGFYVEALSPETVAVLVGDSRAEVPRYWLARMLYRIGLHGRLGYVETYGGFFVDDRADAVRFGIRGSMGSESVAVSREKSMQTIERMYRAVAPPGYRERPA